MTAHKATHTAFRQSWRCYSGVRRGVYVVAMARPWRPEMDDVDRLSKGGAAKRRGTGSFHIPHRLNSDERPVYEAAKKKGFLQVRGTAYRKGRKGHPLPNIYRQWCDAKAQPCILIEQDASGRDTDVVVVDLTPLRSNNIAWAVERSMQLAQAAGARHIQHVERPLHAVPFDTIPVPALSAQELLASAGQAGFAAVPEPPPSPEEVAAAEIRVHEQAEAVRQLKSLGLLNAHPEVQEQVQELLKLKAQLQELLERATAAEMAATNSSSISDVPMNHHRVAADQLESSSATAQLTTVLELEEPQQQQQQQQQHTSKSAIGASSSSSSSSTATATATATATISATAPRTTSTAKAVLDGDHPFAKVAIWQLPVVPLFFEANRPVAKQLAKDLMDALTV